MCDVGFNFFKIVGEIMKANGGEKKSDSLGCEVKRGKGRPRKVVADVVPIEPKEIDGRAKKNLLAYAKTLGFIATGSTVDDALKLSGNAIDVNTFWRIKGTSVQFDNMYYEAIKSRAEILAERVEEACMNADEKSANACRVKLEMVKWRLAKLCPKRYGDVPQGTTAIAIQVAWKGNDGGAVKVVGAVTPDSLKNDK